MKDRVGSNMSLSAPNVYHIPSFLVQPPWIHNLHTHTNVCTLKHTHKTHKAHKQTYEKQHLEKVINTKVHTHSKRDSHTHTHTHTRTRTHTHTHTPKAVWQAAIYCPVPSFPLPSHKHPGRQAGMQAGTHKHAHTCIHSCIHAHHVYV